MIVFERSFKKDFEKAKKRGKDLEKFREIIELLIQGKSLPTKNRNHKLKGNYKDCFECHIEPDWLLIYRKTSREIILVRTGTHSDLF